MLIKMDKWPAEELLDDIQKITVCSRPHYKKPKMRMFSNGHIEVVDEENNVVVHCATAIDSNCYSNECVALVKTSPKW